MRLPLRILLVDDHEVVRSGFRRLLEQIHEFTVVGECAGAEDAYHFLGHHSVDVTVMDISLPGMSGIEAVRRIRMRERHARILVFSVHESAAVVRRALDAGAAGYLSKASAADEMIDAVRAVAAGRRFIGADVARRLADRVHEPDEFTITSRLTRREFEVLRLFSHGQSVDEVAASLHVSPKTVANNLSAIKQKLGARSHADVMRLAIESGLASPGGAADAGEAPGGASH